MYINYVTKNIIISIEMCHVDNDDDDDDDKHCIKNALLRFLNYNILLFLIYWV